MFKSKVQAIFWGIICGASICGFGIYKYFETQSFFVRAKETTATVTSVNQKTESSTEDGQKSYHIKFTTHYKYNVNGETYNDDDINTGQTYEEPRYSRGDVIRIYYDPAHPQDNRFKKEAQWLPYLAMILGLLVFIAGINTLKTKRYSKE